jgi:hypothetical protein
MSLLVKPYLQRRIVQVLFSLGKFDGPPSKEILMPGGFSLPGGSSDRPDPRNSNTGFDFGEIS